MKRASPVAARPNIARIVFRFHKVRLGSMRAYSWLVFTMLVAADISAPAHAQTTDDSLRIYAVKVVKTPPFKGQTTAYGIYLGQGIVITAAHVVGRWPMLTNPRVLMAGQDLPVKIIKKGAFEETDLALLSVDENQLPANVRLRRDPLCTLAPQVGMEVISVVPEATTRARIISPLAIAPQLRKRFNSLIDTEETSGSGLFDAERKCLIGIMSAKVPKFRYQMQNGHILANVDGFAGYFVPASKIGSFIPPDLHF
jgi:hypothetical protein